MGTHATHAIHENSLAVLDTLDVSLRERAILKLMVDGNPRTDREIMTELSFGDMNCVRPRITSLILQKLLAELPQKRRCRVTKKKVRQTAYLSEENQLTLV